MNGSYYYLIDGSQHGPFSRAAIDSLMKTGRLAGALFRTDDETWRTADEMGLSPAAIDAQGVIKDPYGFPIAGATASQQTSASPSPPSSATGSKAGAQIALAVLVVVGCGIWFATSSRTSSPSSDGASDSPPAQDQSGMVETMFSGTGDVILCHEDSCNYKLSWANGFGDLELRGFGSVATGALEHFGSVETKCALFESSSRNYQSAGLCLATRDIDTSGTDYPGPIAKGDVFGALRILGQSFRFPIQGTARPAGIPSSSAQQDVPKQSHIDAANPLESEQVELVDSGSHGQDQSSASQPVTPTAPADVFVEAKALSMPPPQYPAAEKEANIEGQTVLRVEINVDGTVSNVEVTRSSRNRNFDRSAINAAMAWTFSPATMNGGPVPTTATIPVDFTLGPEPL